MFSSYSHRVLFILPGIGLGICPAYSQTPDSLPSQQIYVEKAYEPVLADAVKIFLHPELPSPETQQPPALQYSLTTRPLSFSYAPETLKPLAMMKEKPEAITPFYLKAGFGTLATPLFEFYLNSLRSQKHSYSAFLRHTSSKSGLAGQSAGETAIGGSAKACFRKQALSGGLQYHRFSHHYYGYDHGDTVFTVNELRTATDLAEGKLSFSNYAGNVKQINYSADAKVWYLGRSVPASLQARFPSYPSETGGKMDASLSKTLQSKDAAGLDLALTSSSFDGTEIFTGQATPSFTFTRDKWQLRVGGAVGWDMDEMLLFPAFAFSRDLIGKKLIYYNGWTGFIQPAGYRVFFEQNPFVAPSLALLSSHVEHRYTGIRGTFENKLFYNLMFSQKLVDNWPVFVSDSLDDRLFRVSYYNYARVNNIHAEFAFLQSEKLQLNLEVDVFAYNKLNDYVIVTKPLHSPSFKATFVAHYNIGDKMVFSGEVFVLGERIANGFSDGVLPPVFDASLGLRYNYLKNFGFFFNLRNITGSKYMLWYNYPAFGRSLLGGLFLSF